MNMQAIKKFYGAHPIRRAALTIILLIALIALCYYLPAFSLKARTADNQGVASAVGEEIAVGGEVVLSQNGGRTLSLDTKEMIFTLTDDATGIKWSSAVKGAQAGSEKALLNLWYLADDNNLSQWNTYDNCVAFGDYRLLSIENGVRVEMDVNEGESQAFYEYLPQRLPIERYEDFFLPTLEAKAASGDITSATAAKYKRTLGMVYKKNASEGCYIVSYIGNPPVSAVTQLIDLTRVIGYTRDMLIEDCEAAGITVTFHEPAKFDLVLEVRLEDGDLIARVPSDETKSYNDYYRVQRIAVLPNMGAVASNENLDGYVLTPDGAGALMRFNTNNAVVPEYVRPYYDNDYYADYYYMPEFGQELMLPVFGLLYGGETPQSGLLAIMEKGAETANLHVSLAGAAGTGAAYNKAYVSFDALDYSKVKIYGAYNDNTATYLADSGHVDVDFTVRYRAFARPVTYYDLAVDYRAYLVESTGAAVDKAYNPGVYLETTGAVTLKNRFLGVPYDAPYAMTSYEELTDILNRLPEGKLTVQYDGMFNGGVVSTLNNGAALVAQNGSLAALKTLEKTAAKRNAEIFYQINLSRVYRENGAFLPFFHALRDFSNSAATIYRYTPTMGVFNGKWQPSRFYYQLSPRYLGDVTDKFLAASDDYKHIAIGDLARDFYADYRYREVLNAVSSRALVSDALHALADQKTLALHDPAGEYAALGAYAVDLSRESGDYVSFYATVPFRQLALSSMTEMTTEDVNLSSRSLDYFLLQAAELGVDVKFSVTGKRADILKNSHFEYLYAVWFEDWEDDIKAAMAACEALRDALGGQQIVNHRLLAPGVFETTYSGGARVTCNYTGAPVQTAEGDIAPLSYRITEGGE